MISINKNKKFTLVVGILVILIITTFLVSLNTGSLAIAPSDVIKTLIGQGSKSQEIAIFKLRLPRIVIGILVGTALAIAGTILQGVTKNDLADSGILGINSGAALFVVVYIFIMNGNVYDGISNMTIFTMPLVALSGAIFGAFLIYILAWKNGINSSRLLLIGIGINVAFTSILTIFQLKFTTQEFNRVMAWTSGSIWGASWKYVLAVLPFILIFVILTIYKSRYLDALNLGDEVATGLGVEVEKERRKLIIYAVILAGVATSVAGSIAFLGLIAPHIARKLVGPKHKKLIPTAALVGSLILLVGDTIARNIIAPMELPVGIVVSVIGVPYFIYLMLAD
ncbi:ferrichrome transport system permease FhuG [[Clostridium] sordellii]|uniref:ABC-type transport system, ferrichrome-specific permease n=1 Tax=Paraclostridium sordellii TaxID=1505 RepID=A0ABM9RQ51_PARSO|nr:iron ABC transporter permease [Paeniclostridium sordellii]CEJ74177.1 ABC-type transport system, ferrichrome-specific permease [[Clostridium] sordellii] [Paeniclostridium sordellii]CEN69721.1 ferrichrome transport system permease FhuG [[Clostridium] sordellii] [Paeniclostridium sordellii]CEN72989.1 ferrichrome transport system permease FhuG [[Clostridium] sordellii] [Paeniclostridium sordellii]CEO25456.1 ferrichrome transport system permease FhuG [[Clostridium] sordellii] [Paeniclostridium so